MEQMSTTNPCGARQASCPTWLRRRMRRRLVRASPDRRDKSRAQQALCLLADLDNRADAVITPEQRSSNSPPSARNAPSVPIAAAWPAQDVSGGRRKEPIGPGAGGGEDRDGRDRPGASTILLPCSCRGAIPPTGLAGRVHQDPQSKGSHHELE